MHPRSAAPESAEAVSPGQRLSQPGIQGVAGDIELRGQRRQVPFAGILLQFLRQGEHRPERAAAVEQRGADGPSH